MFDKQVSEIQKDKTINCTGFCTEKKRKIKN